MKSMPLRAKMRLPLAVLLSFLLVFSLNTPFWAYADEEIVSEAASEEGTLDEGDTLEDEQASTENETSSEERTSSDTESDEKEVTIPEDEAIDSDITPQATSISESSSTTVEPTESVAPFAVGDVFVATIDVDNGGTVTSIPCTYEVTSDTPSNLQAQIGNGAVAAIAIATPGALILPTTVTDTGTSTTYNVTSIGDSAFMSCTLLTGTGLGSNSTITQLGNDAFWDCESLTDTGLGSNSSVTTVSAGAFALCESLLTTGLATNSTVTSLGQDAFESCFALTSTGLGTNTTLTSLSAEVFDSCYALVDTGFATNTTITSIGEYAFYSCITLPDTGLGSNSTITTLGGGAFGFCIALTDTGLATNSAISVINFDTFAFCDSLTDTGLGSNSTITSLGTSAFYSCISLTDTGLATNTTITSLGNSVFRLCDSLGTVGTASTNQGDLVLNSQITSIGTNAFGGTSYERTYLLAPTSSDVTVGNNAFNFLGGQGTLFVPESWDDGSSPITLPNGLYTYSDADGTLVVMYAPSVEITIIDVTRVSGTSDQANVTFQVDIDPDVIIRDSSGAILWTGTVSAGVPTTATLSGLSSDSLSGFTIEATGGSITYPEGVTPRVYNTVTGAGIEALAVPAITYSVVFDGNGADNNDAMQADTMLLTYGDAATLVANAYVRSGYIFLGWNTEADGSGTFFADESSVLNLTNIQDGVVTLFAQWEIESVISPTTPSEEVTSAAEAAVLSQTADNQLLWTSLVLSALIAASLSLVALRKRASKS